MTLLLLQGDISIPNLVQYGQAGLLGILFICLLIFLLRAMPTWKSVKDGDKEVKIAEIGVRDKEAEARLKEAESRIQQANGFGQLAGALTEMSGLIKEVVVDQRHETNKAIMMSRVTADSTDEMMAMMTDISAEMAFIKEVFVGQKNGTQAKQAPTT